MKLVISSAANRDLESIRRYTIEQAPHNVVAFMETILDCCATIADSPLRYPVVPSQAAEGLRKRRFAPYLIFFVASETRVDILRILHERTDYLRLMALGPLQGSHD